MEHKDGKRSDQNANLNSPVISSDLLNRCISGRRGGRLSSILPSRLLTPGGTKKRVFVPNIPTRQEKPKENNSQEKSTETQASSGRGRKFQDRGDSSRGRGRGKKEFVQLKSSVFGDGPPERLIKKEHVSRFSERGGGDSMSMPKYTPVSVGSKSDDENEDESLRKLFKDNLLYNDYDDDDLAPVKLPLISELKCKKEEIKPDVSKIKIKQEPDDSSFVIKQEPDDDMDEMMDYDYESKIKNEIDTKNIKTGLIKPENEVKKEPFAELFRNNTIHESGELLLFHFPDCLPRNSIIDEDNAVEDRDANIDDQCQKNCKSSLKEMSEGFIGKLQILKSGKVRLKIGAMYFDITEGSQIGFLQQVVSLNMRENSGDFHVLGHIKNKVVCFPNLENLTNYSYACT